MTVKTHDKICEDSFFGSVTVGERGQVVIPADARKTLGLSAGDRLLVLLHPFGHGLVLTKIEHVQEAISFFQRALVSADEGAVTDKGDKGELDR